MLKKIIIVLFLVFFISLFIKADNLKGGSDFYSNTLLKISNIINKEGIEDKESLIKIKAEILKTKLNNESEREYLDNLLTYLKGNNIYELNSLIASSDVKEGIFFLKDGEKRLESFVLNKNDSLNKKLEKSLKYFENFLKEEGLENFLSKKKFSPIILGGDVLRGERHLYFIKNEENWRSPFIIFSYDEKGKENGELSIFYNLGKIFSASMGPFFIENSFSIVKVKEKLKKHYLTSEELKIKLMGILFLKYLIEGEILSKNLHREPVELFFKDFNPKEKNFIFLNQYFKDRDEKTFFLNSKKLLKTILKIEKKGDYKAFELLISGSHSEEDD